MAPDVHALILRVISNAAVEASAPPASLKK